MVRFGGSVLAGFFRKSVVCAVLAAALSMARLVQADPVPPDAGRILETVRPAAPAREKPPPMPQTEEPAGALREGASEIRIPLKRIRITGVTRFPLAELEALVRDAIGREIALTELDELARRITRHYRSHDVMLARAYVPAQDIVDGGVEIAVLEGRYGQVLVRNQSGLDAEVESALTARMLAGEVITDSLVQRVTWLADDLPGIEAAATLRPGARLGTSDFILELRDGVARQASLELDNSGGLYTGRVRLGGALAFNNPTGSGDRISTRLLTSGQGLVYGSLAYQRPLGYDGGHLDLSLTRADYELGKSFRNLDATGSAQVAAAQWSHALIRSTRNNLRLQAGLQYKRLQDRDIGGESRKRARLFHFGFSGDRDGAAGKWAYSGQVNLGRLAIESAADRALDATTAGVHGGFAKLSWNGSLRRYLGKGFTLNASYSGQWAFNNLDSSEKMSLGGPFGVRGYPTSEASGDRAHLLRLELGYPLLLDEGVNPDLILSLDHGASRGVTDPWPGLTGARLRHLYSAGVGLAWNSPTKWRLRLEYALALGSEAALSEPDRPGRFWFSFSRQW